MQFNSKAKDHWENVLDDRELILGDQNKDL